MSFSSKVLARVKEVVGNPSLVRKEIDDCMDLFGEREILTRIESFRKVIAVGDIHGDLETLLLILDNLSVEEIDEGETAVVFLGDYVDRGSQQLECLLVVLELKRLYPRSVFVLRGNHEPPPHLTPWPHDFPWQLEQLYGRLEGARVYSLCLDLFQRLPLAAFWGEGALFVHGGLPTENYKKASSIEEYLDTNAKEWSDVHTEILWNDPAEIDDVRIPSPRGAGFLWGKPVTKWVRKGFGVKLVVRGHEPSLQGYKLNHDNTVLTIFSRRGPPYFNEKACIAVLDSTIGWWEKPESTLRCF